MSTVPTIMKAPEARRSSAARATAQPQAAHPDHVRPTPIGDAIVRIEAEYREMPGLSLTVRQAARLWGMDRSTCELVLANLIERRVLKRAWNGTYVRRR